MTLAAEAHANLLQDGPEGDRTRDVLRRRTLEAVRVRRIREVQTAAVVRLDRHAHDERALQQMQMCA